MELKFSPRKDFPGRGPCIQMVGNWVTEKVWDVVKDILTDNLIASPAYQARQKATAFFQGGHHDRSGEWILIECWAAEENCQEFLKLLNERVNAVIDEHRTVIAIIAKSNNERDIKYVEQTCELIAEDTGCPVGGEVEKMENRARVVFLPKDNVTYEKVRQLTMRFELHRLEWSKSTNATER